MSEQVKNRPLSSGGGYYVDKDCCINHEACVYNAPNNFRMDRENSGAHVFKQPDTPEEEAQCRLAMEECPMGAIQHYGEAQITSDDRVTQYEATTR